jgi:hypothetical protein
VAREFAAHVRAYNVYIIEAHACDEWALPENAEVGIDSLAQPTSHESRLAAAREFISRFTPQMETVVDAITDAVELAYEARPERLYILDGRSGQPTVMFRSGPGPFQYSVPELAQFLSAQFKEAA